MFIWDFLLGDVMDQVLDWAYGHIIGYLSDFFVLMGEMGIELFELSWIQSIILFFSYLAWTLYVIGIVVAVFEFAIESQNGRGSIQDLGMHIIKGFMAASLFSVVPIRLYELSVQMQSTLTAGLTGSGRTVADLGMEIVDSITVEGSVSDVVLTDVFGMTDMLTSPIMILFIVIMMGYAVIKVFFASLKRGGILLIQIAVGSLYMFSVPRGYMDGFVSWSKQIVGLCLTSFLQVTILTAGLMILKDHALLGLGVMLSATEVPRIAGAFGLDTGTKANVVGAVHTASMAVNTTRTISQVVAR